MKESLHYYSFGDLIMSHIAQVCHYIVNENLTNYRE